MLGSSPGDERPAAIRSVEEAQLGAVARLFVRGVVKSGRVVLALLEHARHGVDDLPVGGGRVCWREHERGERPRPAELALARSEAAHAPQLLGEAQVGQAVDTKMVEARVEKVGRVCPRKGSVVGLAEGAFVG